MTVKHLGSNPGRLDDKELTKGSIATMSKNATLYLLSNQYPYKIQFDQPAKTTKIPDMFKQGKTNKRKNSVEDDEPKKKQRTDEAPKLQCDTPVEQTNESAGPERRVELSIKDAMSDSDSDDHITQKLKAMKDTLNKTDKNTQHIALKPSTQSKVCSIVRCSVDVSLIHL